MLYNCWWLISYSNELRLYHYEEVAVIDCQLRCPSCHELFHIDRHEELDEHIMDLGRNQQCIDCYDKIYQKNQERVRDEKLISFV